MDVVMLHTALHSIMCHPVAVNACETAAAGSSAPILHILMYRFVLQQEAGDESSALAIILLCIPFAVAHGDKLNPQV